MPRWFAHAVAALVCGLCAVSLAAEVKVEGLVKALDVKQRSVTIEKKTTKGNKEVTLDVAEEAGDLASLKVGDEVSLSYDTTLEVVTSITSPAIPAEEGFVDLIKTGSLSGWYFTGRLQEKDKPASLTKNWEVRNGVVKNTAAGRHLASDEKYRDFEIVFDFQVPPNCNSGIYLRGRYEVKLKHADPLATKPEQRCGAIYALIAPSENVEIVPGRWNTCRVRLQGNTVSVVVNEKVVIDNKELPNEVPPHFNADPFAPGPIVLHSHQNGVGIMYRNMRVKRLNE